MKKLHLIDLVVAFFVLGLAAIVLIGYFRPYSATSVEIYLTGRVVENSADIFDEAQGQIGKSVYFNGTKEAVTLAAASQKGPDLYLTVKGPGKIEPERYIFNGVSTATGQKAEIHSNFQAKLIISDISNVQPK